MSPEDKALLQKITAEGNFWQLFKMVFSVDFTLANKLVPICVLIVVFCLNMPMQGRFIGFGEVVSSAKDLIGWNFTILGFMIAGYAIFTTVTSWELSLFLMRKKEGKTELPYLKYIHAVFLKAILVFVMAVIPPFVCAEFVKKSGLAYLVVNEFGSNLGYVYSFLHAVNVSLFVLSLMMLKSFVFNIYASVMMAIRWSASK